MKLRKMYSAAKILTLIAVLTAVISLSLYISQCLKSARPEAFARTSSDDTVSIAFSEKTEIIPCDTPVPKVGISLGDEDMKYLVLVNFENSYTDNPQLVPNSYVFDERYCSWCNRSCNETAGRALNEMFAAGMRAGYGPFIVNSSYRDRSEQTGIWNEKLEKDPSYGKNPYENPVRAMPPGKSEHETGLAFDVLTKEHPFANKWFGTFPDGIWLRENCARYGFILRYPEDKMHITGVMYEPWHFRYVGVDAATYMYEHNLCLEELWELIGD